MGAKKKIPETFSFHPFEGLNKIFESSAGKTPKPVSLPKEKLPSDEELFVSAMAGVREIREFRTLQPSPKKAVVPCRKKEADTCALKVLEEIVAGRRPVNLADTQEYVEWVNDDFRGDIARMLHEGRFSVKDCIDLHGLSVEESEEAVESFFREALKKGHQCIKIIHGRGLRSPRGPVVKDTLVKSLSRKYRKYVIAFVTARQCDGGLGALYVLLK